MTIIDVDASHVARTGFFCYMSKKKAPGYGLKFRWLEKRFAERLRIKMLELPERGFIEYLPGEYAWRAIEAKGYMAVHCLWVVGKSKGRGYGKVLLNACVEDAKRAGMKGVAMVASEGPWLAGKRVLERAGFECVDTAPPSFSLMVKVFGKNPKPRFSGDWEKKAALFGKGLTVIRTDQCPYIEDAATSAVEAAAKAKVKSRVVELKSAAEIREKSPSAYGAFGLVFNGRLISYHYLLEKDLWPLLK
ncbi:MAG: GNAT family N-acetyltransferase [Candidatus Aminicenantes bacterium]|nr:GNAT family N-acetyltransferase [Candidatus Aminicenantes bacterium]